MKATTHEYGTVAASIHWISMFLIIAMPPLGWYMTGLDAADPMKVNLYRVHILLGNLIVLLTLARIAWIFIGGRPEELPKMENRLQTMAFKGVHLLIYGALLLLGVSGFALVTLGGLQPILISGQGPVPDLFNLPPARVHDLTAWVFIALFVAHLGGVFFYQFTKGDTLARMGLKGLPSAK